MEQEPHAPEGDERADRTDEGRAELANMLASHPRWFFGADGDWLPAAQALYSQGINKDGSAVSDPDLAICALCCRTYIKDDAPRGGPDQLWCGEWCANRTQSTGRRDLPTRWQPCANPACGVGHKAVGLRRSKKMGGTLRMFVQRTCPPPWQPWRSEGMKRGVPQPGSPFALSDCGKLDVSRRRAKTLYERRTAERVKVRRSLAMYHLVKHGGLSVGQVAYNAHRTPDQVEDAIAWATTQMRHLFTCPTRKGCTGRAWAIHRYARLYKYAAVGRLAELAGRAGITVTDWLLAIDVEAPK